MAVGKKRRFEVFKRDAFTCAYCGRKPPTVTLEVDHIIPVAEGGGDDYENLATSCFDCNRGKSAGLLDDRAPVPNVAEQTELMREREAQLREYHAVKQAERERKDRDFAECWNYWFKLWDVETMRRWETPFEGYLRKAIGVLGVDEVKEAMDIAHDRCGYLSSKPAKYLGGVLRRKIAAAEGRLTYCTICDEPMVLDPGEDALADWYHFACKEKEAQA